MRDGSRSDAGHVDVLIVGAGVSGIGAAHHLRERFPDRTFAVLDAQEHHGGTWWTQRFPGVRSDSDLYTYAYRFKPWHGPSIASGDKILRYLDEVVAEDGLGPHLRPRHRVTAASWSSADRTWSVDVTRDDTGEDLRFTTDFLWMCAGYYRHGDPYRPEWPGTERFAGRIVHSMTWPDDLDLTGRRVVVIGSGSTAATLIPAIAEQAAHVTMLQRSPSYYIAKPTVTELGTTLEALDVPRAWTSEILRRQFVGQTQWLARTALEDPQLVHDYLLENVRPVLPENFDVEQHLTPRYRPWQQRVCIVPDGDFFTALREKKASIVTDTVETFTEHGIRLRSGEELPADVVVSATGFNLVVFGDVALSVDGEPVDVADRVTWRGLMLSGVPNMAYVFGYLRHSWTLRVDLVADVVCRLLAHLRERGATTVTPTLRAQDADMALLPWSDPANFNPGYITRSLHLLYRQGDRPPWNHMLEHDEEQHVLPDVDLEDGSLRYA
ncbi:flavin-containing monooxygenase [Actinomycetospora sp. C-140]